MTTSTIMKGGELRATVLSVYDLSTRDQPSYVSISACGATVTTAAPTSRHKDRNSFKFNSASNSSTSELILKAKKLEQLYSTSFKVEVVYENKPWLNVTSSYHMSDLKVMEATWLSLSLEPANANANNPTAMTESNNTGSTSMMEDVPPTIRLRVQLKGPYRPEVAALLSLSQSWFQFMDRIESSTTNLIDKAPTVPLPANKGLLLVPALPVITGALVVAPIVAGICVLFLPVFVPVLAAILVIAGVTGTSALTLYASTSTGRNHVAGLLDQSGAKAALLQTPSGQALLFETGPRPTPVTVAKTVLPDGMWGRLIVSLVVDSIGSASYLVPVVGEVTDIGWAPLQVILIMAMYDSTTPNLKYVAFAEEILPFTDFVPSATIGWAAQFGPQLLLKQNTGSTSASSSNGVPTQLTVPIITTTKSN